MMSEKKRKTYRVRGISAYIKESSLPRLLQYILSYHGSTDDIQIFSLAPSVDSYERPNPTKEATVGFKDTPSALLPGRNEWIFSKDDTHLSHNVIIDSHFLGFTTLNDVSAEQHEIDCFAISGLASHPFGSWKARDDESTFMWIRDALPTAAPGLRCILFGYDTCLAGSKSFKNIEDISLNFTAQLRSIGCSSPSAKPTIFLAHSLGGIVLKEAFVQLARGNKRDRFVLSQVKEILLFGVPNRGMQVSHILPMVKGQPNEPLIDMLSEGSPYLEELATQFSGISFHRSMRIISIYETHKSQIPKEISPGMWTRSGPYEVLVNKQSAVYTHLNAAAIYSIDKDHSNLVKFSEHEPDLNVVLGLLQSSQHTIARALPAMILPSNSTSTHHGSHLQTSSRMPIRLVEVYRDSLYFYDICLRYDSVEVAHSDTMDWIFHSETTTLKTWLHDDTPLYWVTGKPGSGKSTAMKYIFEHRNENRSQAMPYRPRIDAQFFFSHRGSHLQKSFDGLLRSLLHQITGASKGLAERMIAYELQALQLDMNSLSEDAIESAYKHYAAGHKYTTAELERALFHVLEQHDESIDLSLFLDALDELDANPENIVSFLSSCVRKAEGSLTNLKICFASRPWNVFHNEFAESPHFCMEDHTGAAMAFYVNARLYGDKVFSKALRDSDPQMRATLNSFPVTLLDRAKGVFLWLRLVLDVAIEEIGEGATPQDLALLIETIPDELGELYIALIKRIKPQYRGEAYIMLEIVLRGTLDETSASDPLTLEKFWVAEQCCFLKPNQIGHSHLFDQDNSLPDKGTISRRISSRCGGLVEIITRPAGKPPLVQLMHQTVKDFLLRPMTWSHFMSRDQGPRTSNGHSFLTQYYLNMAYTFNGDEDEDHENFKNLIHPLCRHAELADLTTGKSQASLLRSIQDADYVNIGEELFCGTLMPHCPIFSRLSFAVVIHLSLFVREEIGKRTFTAIELGRLLHCFLGHKLCIAENCFPPCIGIGTEKMVQLLLEAGADTELRVAGRTPWELWVMILPDGERDEHDTRVTELLLSYPGADPNALIPANSRTTCKYWMRPLHFVIETASVEDIKILLQAGANVNGADSRGLTPLSYVRRALQDRHGDARHEQWTNCEVFLNSMVLREASR